MRGGKNVPQTQAAVPNEGPTASGSRTTAADEGFTLVDEPNVSGSAVTQPTISDRQSHLSSTTPSSSNSGTYQNVLVECNNLIE